MEGIDGLSSDFCPLDLFLEFLEVCFHTILYSRKVYPESIFTLKKKYNVPIHISLYPDLNNYISEVLKSVKKFLISNKLREISLWILDSSLKPVESFVFSNINIYPIFLLNERVTSSSDELTQCFRAVCLKLTTADSLLQPLEINSSFKVFVKTEDSYSTSANMLEHPEFQEFPWITEDRFTASDFKEIIPIRNVHTQFFQFELYVQV